MRKCARAECGNLVKGWLKYCSEKCREGVRRRFTKEGLAYNLKSIAQALGRVPAKREALDIAYACVYYFGSWNKAVTEAGLDPHRSHSKRMYRRMNTTAKDGHVCDSVSEAIIDDWLTDRNIEHARDFPYPATHHKADWNIGGVFVEYFGLAKDSPRYDRAVQRKKNLCREYGIPLVEIYPEDIYPEVVFESKLKDILLRAHS